MPESGPGRRLRVHNGRVTDVDECPACGSLLVPSDGDGDGDGDGDAAACPLCGWSA